MISEFITTYYIDPIRYGQPYTIVDTLTYAVILIAAVFLIYRWFNLTGFTVDGKFVLATVPFVIFGGLLRVVEDTGFITSDHHLLLVTPLIFFVMFFFTITALFISRTLERVGIIASYHTGYSCIGTIGCIVLAAFMAWFGFTYTQVSLSILLIILALAIVSSAAIWGFMRYVLKWEYASDPLYCVLIFGQMLDASATSYGIDLHTIAYTEVHVVGGALIAWTGTAFSMFPLKLAVIFPAVYILQLYRKEAPQVLWHLILLAMIIVGFGPGVRGMVRMVLFI
ncbi:MAG: DUF63 family protein [Methanoregula sp.]|nr:DUF63 family protein [Methanoregula sp.]